MQKIITVSGTAQSGKDTFANFAKEYYDSKNKKCIIFHYADFLKFICKQYFCWNGVKDTEGRQLLQYVGTNLFRKNNPDCWIEMAKSFASGIGDTVEYIIIPDTRFPNEISCWKEEKSRKIISIRVKRPNFDNGLTEEQKNHESETALNDWKFDNEIVNDGSIDDYKQKVFDLLTSFCEF